MLKVSSLLAAGAWLGIRARESEPERMERHSCGGEHGEERENLAAQAQAHVRREEHEDRTVHQLPAAQGRTGHVQPERRRRHLIEEARQDPEDRRVLAQIPLRADRSLHALRIGGVALTLEGDHSEKFATTSQSASRSAYRAVTVAIIKSSLEATTAESRPMPPRGVAPG